MHSSREETQKAIVDLKEAAKRKEDKDKDKDKEKEKEENSDSDSDSDGDSGDQKAHDTQ
jgi:hypothetical protein